jgi:hypothetical protein
MKEKPEPDSRVPLIGAVTVMRSNGTLVKIADRPSDTGALATAPTGHHLEAAAI